MTLNGIFNIDKPIGLTSHDVVARLRRLIRTHAEQIGIPRPTVRSLKVGHAGTLDPLATGVLPLAVGSATRLLEYLSDADKAYRATVTLGATSTTYDAEGELTPSLDTPTPSLAQIESALNLFKGEIAQLPPMHSAIKVGGQKLYDLARRGVEIERQPRQVTIKKLTLEAYKPPTLQIFVECTKGTYIRSLAHDLGTALSTGAYLSSLRRTQHGPFSVETATTLEALEIAFTNGTWSESLYSPTLILSGWPSHTATLEQQRDIEQGKTLPLPNPNGYTKLAAYTQSGELLAILYWDDGREVWQPKKVFTQPTNQ